MLAKIFNGVVVEIIPENNPIFPGIPVEDRYSPEFLKDCVKCDDTVRQGYLYSNGEFSEPVIPEPPIPEPEEVSE